MLFKSSHSDHLSRREREKIYKRTEILSAAVPLFAEKGYDNTTIEDIAEKAEIGKGTLYNYFSSKEDIYWGILEEIFTDYLEGLTQIDRNYISFLDFIRQLTRELFGFCVENHNAFIIITRLRTSLTRETSKLTQSMIDYQNKVDMIFISRVKKAIENNEINDIEPKTFFTLYRSMIFPYIYNQMFCNQKDNLDIEAESELIVNILFNGIKK